MSRNVSRPGRRFGALKLSEYGWGRRALLIAAALAGSVVFGYAANLASRQALWSVVRACVLDKTTTGSPLPCLEVNLDDGRERGYVVLRPPIGRPDTILAPTRAIVGLEDQQLQAPDAPNYFALAWDNRHWVDGAEPDERVALAVNTELARTQDQLHVHIGCVAASFAERLGAAALGPSPRAWFRSADMGPGLEFWSYRSGAKDFRALEPFRLLKELEKDPRVMRRTTLAVAWARGELVVVALRSRPGGWYAAAEDVLDARC